METNMFMNCYLLQVKSRSEGGASCNDKVVFQRTSV